MWEVWNHLPYSPDLAPSDYFTFPALKRNLSGTRFTSDNALKTVAERWPNEQELDYYQDGINKLIERSNKCLIRFVAYVEKWRPDVSLDSHLYLTSIVYKYFFICLVNFFSGLPLVCSTIHIEINIFHSDVQKYVLHIGHTKDFWCIVDIAWKRLEMHFKLCFMVCFCNTKF